MYEQLVRRVAELERRLAEREADENAAGVFWDDLLPIPVSQAQSNQPPASTVFANNLFASEFPYNATKSLIQGWQFPHAWDEGTAISPHAHLYIPAGTTGVIRMSFAYVWTNIDEAEPAIATITGTYNKASGAASNGNAVLEFDSAAISPTGRTMSSILWAGIFRTSGDTGDTFDASVWLKSTDIHIMRDGAGSRAEYVK